MLNDVCSEIANGFQFASQGLPSNSDSDFILITNIDVGMCYSPCCLREFSEDLAGMKSNFRVGLGDVISG